MFSPPPLTPLPIPTTPTRKVPSPPSPRGTPTRVIQVRSPARQTRSTTRKRDRVKVKAAVSRRAVLQALQALDARLSANPLMAQCCIVAMLASVGDITAQLLEGTNVWALDPARLLRFAAFRSAIATPLYHIWLHQLELRVAALALQSSAASTAIKTCLDQFLYIPFYQTLFYLSLAFAEGQPLHEGRQRVLRMLPRSLPVNWVFWVPFMAANFLYIPVKWRLVVANVGSLLWAVVMSSFNQSARSPPSIPPQYGLPPPLPYMDPGAGVNGHGGMPMNGEMVTSEIVEMSEIVEASKALLAATTTAAATTAAAIVHEECRDLWSRRWCLHRAGKCWSDWVLTVCPRTCGMCSLHGLSLD